MSGICSAHKHKEPGCKQCEGGMCKHDLADKDTACADGMCPICMSQEISRLRDKEKEYESLLDEFWDMRNLQPASFQGTLLNRLRAFSKPPREPK